MKFLDWNCIPENTHRHTPTSARAHTHTHTHTHTADHHSVKLDRSYLKSIGTSIYNYMHYILFLNFFHRQDKTSSEIKCPSSELIIHLSFIAYIYIGFINLNHLQYLEDLKCLCKCLQWFTHSIVYVLISFMFWHSWISCPGLRMWLVCLLGWPNWKDSCPGVVHGLWCFRSYSTLGRHERFQVHCCCEQRCRCAHISGDDLNFLLFLSHNC